MFSGARRPANPISLVKADENRFWLNGVTTSNISRWALRWLKKKIRWCQNSETGVLKSRPRGSKFYATLSRPIAASIAAVLAGIHTWYSSSSLTRTCGGLRGNSDYTRSNNSIINYLSLTYLARQHTAPVNARQLTSAVLRHGPVVRKRDIK